MGSLQNNSVVSASSRSEYSDTAQKERFHSFSWICAGAILQLSLGMSVASIAGAQDAPNRQDAVVETRAAPLRKNLPPRAVQAQKFLAQRGISADLIQRKVSTTFRRELGDTARPLASGATTSTWQAIGPTAVSTSNYGMITGRVSSLALDPSDPTGNHLFVGTTGGGVWLSQNADASNLPYIAFIPLTDTVAALSGAADASISIGALTVQPGSTGVLLAGTGDPNDALDSYYGAGILRSTDGGNSWNLISTTSDVTWGFMGEGFAGFAWSTVNTQVVVAAVSQAYEGTLVSATQSGLSYQGLYYSSDSGATWNLATINDGSTGVQGPLTGFDLPDGNAATAVVWNPVRQLFLAAVRYHGYYQSSDGKTWSRLVTQPGNLTAALCPTNQGSTGSIACPIFRGALAVNPQTGDTFAWTTDAYNQNQGLWQDVCNFTAGSCANQNPTFAKQWNTAPLESNTTEGTATIANGDYNLVLAAIPSQQDTLLLAGANDLWKCSLAEGCVWRNTTNASTCQSAQVGEYQHALAWNPNNPQEVFLGNDSGLWRSTDAIGETGSVCASTDASHFQNLNSGLGSLTEVDSLATSSSTPYTLMTGLGVSGTAGVKGNVQPSGNWPQILSGDGGPVAIDQQNGSNWYVNNGAGVSIHRCNKATSCTAADFGTNPLINNADVSGDGLAMTTAAPFLVDPLDDTQLLIATCRVWRGPANGTGWSTTNAISPLLDGGTGSSSCNGDAQIRSLAAAPLPNGKEVVYVGMYGAANGGGRLPGHVLSATVDPTSSSMPVWTDLSAKPVTNDVNPMNAYGMDISSLYIDPHDVTGKTLYVTVEGTLNPKENIQALYRTTDGGAHWASLISNLPETPASSVVVDPLDANTVYVAMDRGVYYTQRIASCTSGPANCWSYYGTGLPEAPVIALNAAPVTSTVQTLTAATYGRGVWQIPLLTANTQLTSATASPAALNFASQVMGTASAAQTVTLTNTGSTSLDVTLLATSSAEFKETDTCLNLAVVPGASCAVQVTFTPTAIGTRTGQLTVFANVSGGQFTVSLNGTGAALPIINLTPTTVNFGSVEVGTTSLPLQVTASNGSASPVPITSLTVSPPFEISGNSCGTSQLAANTACQMTIEFAPIAAGAASGTLTMTDNGGTQTVQLSGNGAAPPTDGLAPMALTLANTILGQLSAPQVVTLTNSGDLPLTSIALSASGAFQVSSNCGTQLSGPSNCAINVVFAPLAVGYQTGTLSVSDILGTQTISLAGTGLLPPVFSMSPTTLNFPSEAVGATSPPMTVTVNNIGGAPMTNIGFQITGPSSSSFALTATSCGVLLNNGSSCTAQLTFSPLASGGSSATLTVSTATIGVVASTVSLTGAGTSPTALLVTPAQLAFPVVLIGQTSAAQTLRITNSGTNPATALALSVPTPFSLTQNTCPSTLAIGASCSVGVVFMPFASGAATGALSITSASVITASSVALSGTGGLPSTIQATPGAIGFGPVGVSQTSNATTVTITNLGAISTLSNLTILVTAGYQLVNNTCPTTLAPQATCSVGVEFAPTATGAQPGTFTVTSGTAATPATISLTGTGFDFTVTSVGSVSQTVTAGLTANYTLLITPMGGAQATYSYTCGTLPAGAQCTFNPTTLTTVAAAGNLAVTISTRQATARAFEPTLSRLLPVFCALVLLPFMGKRRTWLLALLGAIMAGGILSCAASGGGTGGSTTGSGGGSGATPSGTYSIPVAVSSNGVQHSLTLTLIVD